MGEVEVMRRYKGVSGEERMGDEWWWGEIDVMGEIEVMARLDNR